jgi:hypothetical protein
MQRNEKRMDENWTFGTGPFALSGRPPFLEGVVELINNTERDQEITAIPLRKMALESQRGPVPGHVTILAQLGPHGRTRTTMRLTLDPATPPGRYEAELFCGAQTERVLIHVLPNWQLRIIPEAISVATSAGERLGLQVVVINQGNMELKLPATQSVDLDDTRGLFHLADVVVRQVGKEGFNKFLDRFVRDWAEEAVDPAVIHIRRGDQIIRPGETTEFELALQLPENMKPGRDYKGKIQFKNASVSLEIECR